MLAAVREGCVLKKTQRQGGYLRVLTAARHLINGEPTSLRVLQHIWSTTITIPLNVPVAVPSLAVEDIDKRLAVCLVDKWARSHNRETRAVIADGGRVALGTVLPGGRVGTSVCMAAQQDASERIKGAI